ncbi:MAG: EAL domain-containing protein, partial [Burkholderiaceae bacterium]
RFIPLAEDCGLINALDAWVLETACAQLADWRARGLPVAGMAVNVSPSRFYQDEIAREVDALLRRHELPADALTLEVTERLMLQDQGPASRQLLALDQMGVRLSVDDFGTGYSSLSYLKRLPVAELKLDKSFVRDLETDADDRALAGAVIGIARALSLAVVAEGVETEAQRRVLLELGCDAAQGWLFARPMAAAELEAWLLSWRAADAALTR